MIYRYAIIVLFTWGLIFSAPVFSLNSRHIVGSIGWLYIFTHFHRTKRILYSRDSVFVISYMMVLLLYLATIANFTSGVFQITSFYLYWIIDIIPGVILLIDYVKKNNISLPYILFFSSVIQAVCSLAAYANPNIQEIFLDSMIASGGYTQEFSKVVSKWRMYGISSGLFFDMPILQSFLGCIVIAYGLQKKRMLIVVGILLIMSAVINARIGLVVCVIAMMIGLLNIVFIGFIKRCYSIYAFKNILFLSAILVLLIICFYGKLQENVTINWMGQAIDDVTEIESKGTIHTLLHNMVMLPDGFGILFGEGIRIMGGNSQFSVASDVGYINDCWSGGLLYMFIKYSLFVYIIYKTKQGMRKKYGDSTAWKYTNFSLAILFICNIKGQIFSPNCFTIFILIVYYYFISIRRGEKYGI